MILYITRKNVIEWFNTNYKVDLNPVFPYFIIAMCHLSFNYLHNYSNAKNIMDGKPEFNIEFTYSEDAIKSDTNFVYIGQTQDYIFLRELDKKENYVYAKKEILNLKMVKVDNSIISKPPPKKQDKSGFKEPRK